MVRDGLEESVFRLGQVLTGRGLYLAVAESCTGGLLSHSLTNVSGSSDWFMGAVVAYSNAVKTGLLGVPQAALDGHGAVSEPVVRHMAEGVCRVLGCPVGVAISGVAGPTGGTPDKPVGTVWMAWTLPGGVEAGRFHCQGGRLEVKAQSVAMAVAGLLARLG